MVREVYIGIGTNLGDKLVNISKATDLIQREIGDVLKKSNIYESDPWGFESKEVFLNAVVQLETVETLESTLRKCLIIEESMGRVRESTKGYTNRLIDLDVLLCEQEEISNKILNVPHMHNLKREFVLRPLMDVLNFKSKYFKQYSVGLEGFKPFSTRLRLEEIK